MFYLQFARYKGLVAVVHRAGILHKLRIVDAFVDFEGERLSKCHATNFAGKRCGRRTKMVKVRPFLFHAPFACDTFGAVLPEQMPCYIDFIAISDITAIA